MHKLLLLCAYLLTGCQHICENYVDYAQEVGSLRQEVTALQTENRHLRMYAIDIIEGSCKTR